MNDDNDDDKDIIFSFATVENRNNASKYYLVLDDGKKLYTKEIGETDPEQGVPKDGTRVFAGYSVLNSVAESTGYNYDIKIMGVSYLSVEEIEELTEKNKDEFGNDRFSFYQNIIYIGGDNYLNALISYNITEGNSDHIIRLVKNTLKEYDDEYVHLELLYDNGGDNGTSNVWAPVCFDLSSLKEEGQDSIKISIDTFQESADEVKSYKFTYKWK